MEFYDVDAAVFVDHMTCRTMNGQLASFGSLLNNTTSAYGFEVFLSNIYTDFDGDGTKPVLDLNSYATVQADATNEIDMQNVSIYQPWSTGLAIRNQSTFNNMRNIRMAAVRVEGGRTPYHAANDLVVVGDHGYSGVIDATTCVECELASPFPGKVGLRFTADTQLDGPLNQRWQVNITGVGYGGGVAVDYANGLIELAPTIHLSGAQSYMISVAPSSQVSGRIQIDGSGMESGW